MVEIKRRTSPNRESVRAAFLRIALPSIRTPRPTPEAPKPEPRFKVSREELLGLFSSELCAERAITKMQRRAA